MRKRAEGGLRQKMQSLEDELRAAREAQARLEREADDQRGLIEQLMRGQGEAERREAIARKGWVEAEQREADEKKKWIERLHATAIYLGQAGGGAAIAPTFQLMTY